MNKKMVVYAFMATVITAITMGCVTVNKTGDLSAALNKSATDYWMLRMADKYEETYKMELANKLPVYETYINQARLIKKFPIKSHAIKNVSILGHEGFVDIEFVFEVPPIAKPVKQVIQDKWVYENGDWRHIYSP